MCTELVAAPLADVPGSALKGNSKNKQTPAAHCWRAATKTDVNSHLSSKCFEIDT